MPDLSRITLRHGGVSTTYTVKDEVARSIVGGGICFRGVTTTPLTDQSSTSTYVVGSSTLVASNGDLVIYNRKEFIYSDSDSVWHEFGDNSSFGDLAYESSIDVSYTPAGTISTPVFTGTQGNIAVTGTPTGNVAIGTGVGEPNYTPQGTVSKPNVSVTLSTDTIYAADTATGGGLVTQGTAAACTMPQLSMTVSNETLTLEWTDGTFTANTPTAVTLPTFTSKTVANSVSSAGLDSSPIFTGTGTELTATFTGNELTSAGTFTPSGNVGTPTFTGTPATITVSPI